MNPSPLPCERGGERGVEPNARVVSLFELISGKVLQGEKMRRSLRQRVLWNTLRLEKNGRCESRRLLKQKGLGKKMDIERMFPRAPFSQE
jgi:hypothetical protein